MGKADGGDSETVKPNSGFWDLPTWVRRHVLSFIGAVMLDFGASQGDLSGIRGFVRWCGRLGIALIAIGFLLQLLAKFSQ